jgi:hypothetical protein
LTRDATFRAHAAGILAERTKAKRHPKPTAERGGNFAKTLGTEGSPAPEEIEGRWLLSFWLNGIDEATVLELGSWAIDDHPASLRHLLGLGFDVNAYLKRDGAARDGETLLNLAVRADNLEAVRLLVAAGADPDRKGRKGKKESARKIAVGRKRKAIIAALDGGPAAAASPAFADGLRAAAKALDVKGLRFAASNFGVKKKVDPVAAIEAELAKAPESAEQILEGLGGGHVFDRYLVAAIVRAAGHKPDVRLKGHQILQAPLTVAGSLIVDGVLVDDLGTASVVVAGDLEVHALVTEADCLVGGTLHARDYVWGNYNDGTLAVCGNVETPVLVMTDHTYECAGKQRIQTKDADADEDACARLFVPEVLDDGSVDRDRVIGRLAKKLPIMVTAARKAR